MVEFVWSPERHAHAPVRFRQAVLTVTMIRSLSIDDHEHHGLGALSNELLFLVFEHMSSFPWMTAATRSIDPNASVTDVTAVKCELSALSQASRDGDLELVAMLLEHGDDPQAHWHNRTPLWHAALGGHLEVVSLLLRANAVVTIRDSKGASPLSNAISRDHWQATTLMLDHLQWEPRQVDEALQLAASLGASRTLEVLLTQLQLRRVIDGRSDNAVNEIECANSMSLLGAAAFGGHQQAVEVLLRHGANVNASSGGEWRYTALQLGAMQNHGHVVYALGDADADLDGFSAMNADHAALHVAASKSAFEAIEALVNLGANKHLRAVRWTDAETLSLGLADRLVGVL